MHSVGLWASVRVTKLWVVLEGDSACGFSFHGMESRVTAQCLREVDVVGSNAA